MVNIYQSEEGEKIYKERIDVSFVVQLDAVDRNASASTVERLVVGAETQKSKGPLSIDTDYDEEYSRLKIACAGSLSAAINLLNYKEATGKRFFDESAEVSTIVQINPIDGPFASSLTAHVLASAKQHPQNDAPLRIDSNYDDARLQLQLVLSGSIFAISYFYMILYLRFTQRLERATRYA